jgi:hypothetical protein
MPQIDANDDCAVSELHRYRHTSNCRGLLTVFAPAKLYYSRLQLTQFGFESGSEFVVWFESANAK